MGSRAPIALVLGTTVFGACGISVVGIAPPDGGTSTPDGDARDQGPAGDDAFVGDALPGDDGGGADARVDASCAALCPDAGGSCNGDVCEIGCTTATPCSGAACPPGISCEIGCTNAGACTNLRCEGPSCTIHCTNANACTGVFFTSGAST